MRGHRTRARAALACVVAACAFSTVAAPASALNPLKPVCGATSLVSGIAGKACSAVQNGGRFISAGNKLLHGKVGQAFKTVLGSGSGAGAVTTRALGLVAVGTWAIGGAKFSLQQTDALLAHMTSPQLRSTWFSATYWRMAAISAVLTLPFLFAAAVQAVIRSDLGLLLRAAFGYLPLAMLAVSIAAPLTTMLLAAADELSRLISATAGGTGAHFFSRLSRGVLTAGAVRTSPFVAFVAAVLTVGGAVVLWIELLAREAAVYVIVLMLPLAFAALVWPARRVWAVRAVEVLIALILSKFAVMAVLSLAGAAMASTLSLQSITAWVAGIVLLLLAAFSPWALLRFVPLAELAAGAAGPLRDAGVRGLREAGAVAPHLGLRGPDWAKSTTAAMRSDARDTDGAGAPERRAAGPAAPEPEPETGAAAAPEAEPQPATAPLEPEPEPATAPRKAAGAPSSGARPATTSAASASGGGGVPPPDRTGADPPVIAELGERRVDLDPVLDIRAAAMAPNAPPPAPSTTTDAPAIPARVAITEKTATSDPAAAPSPAGTTTPLAGATEPTADDSDPRPSRPSEQA